MLPGSYNHIKRGYLVFLSLEDQQRSAGITAGGRKRNAAAFYLT
jgi:hypothetical protein